MAKFGVINLAINTGLGINDAVEGIITGSISAITGGVNSVLMAARGSLPNLPPVSFPERRRGLGAPQSQGRRALPPPSYPQEVDVNSPWGDDTRLRYIN